MFTKICCYQHGEAPKERGNMNTSDFYVSLGQKIRSRRKAKHLTLKELSQTLNKSVSTLSKYETGEIIISIDALIDICNILDIDISSLLPDTSSHSEIDITRYSGFLAKRFYLYWYNGEKKRVQIAVLENRTHSMHSTMYYDVKDVDNFYDANFIYEGTIMYSDTSLVYTYTCIAPPFDVLTIRIPFLKSQNSLKMGLLSTISYFYQSIAMKVVLSETPLKNDTKLINMLQISSEDIKNIRRTNFFLI